MSLQTQTKSSNFIQRLIKNPLEIYRKGKMVFRYQQTKYCNRRLLALNNKIPFHYGVWGRGNAGDTVLFKEVENVIQNGPFFQRDLDTGEITQEEINLLNRKANCLVLGGGGLFLKDTNTNSNSGWQFNIKKEVLDSLEVPLIIFAVGYNRFRGQEEFDEVFESHLLKTVSKASFIGLRNRGSIEAIKSYLPKNLSNKIKFQPCPTTIIKKLLPKIEKNFDFSLVKDRKIVVNIAFDREEKRFQGKSAKILATILSVCEKWKKNGWTIEFSGHCMADKKVKTYIKGKYSFVDLTYNSYLNILEYYKNVPVTIGMRGHAQMIPFGIGNAIVSLVSHDKVKWFLNDINHPEWGVELLSDKLEEQLDECLNNVVSNFEEVKQNICEAQDQLYQVTIENVREITRHIRESKQNFQKTGIVF